MGQPLILTMQLDETAQASYEALRRRYFPPERNLIAAHLTLFHQLPDEERTRQALQELARSTPIFPLTNPVLRSIGRGVAVFVESETLAALHATLSSVFQSHLIPQDRQRFRPHIVIQNKVDAETAQRTLRELHAHPFPELEAIGLGLWRYQDGPWEHLRNFAFEAQ